jgi:hypothetical protein
LAKTKRPVHQISFCVTNVAEGLADGEHAPEKTTMTQCNAKPGKLPEGLDLPPPETEDIELQSADVEFTKDRTENQESSSDTSGDHGSLDEEVDEGNLSDGTSIDQYMEFWRAKHEHMELRTKSAPKRVKQIAQYTNILEERVQLLEESATLFDRKLRRITGGVDTLPSPPPEPEDNLLHLKPELNFQLSKGLKNPVPPPGETVAPPTHQIDVFVGEPEAQKAEKFRRGRKIESRSFDDDGMDEQEIPFDPKSDRASKSSDERRLAEEMAKVKSKHFPNRIRFNLTAMVYLFRKYLSTENGTLDNVVLRPFKPLLQNKEDLLNIMSEVVSALARIVSQRTNANTESTKDSSDSEAQGESGETYQPHGVLNITNTASLENHRKSDEITSAPDAITTEEWDIVLKELEFFDEDNGCCGQNMKGWSTVSSVEKSFECFKNLLDNYLLPGHREFRERRAKKIRFCDLWHLFHTGDLVVTKRLAGADETETQAQLGMRVLMTAGGRRVIMPKLPAPALQSSLNLSSSEDKIEPINGVNPFCIHAYYLDYNGSRLVPVRQRILIAPYSGERNISDLEIVPVDYVRGATDMLEERGRRFIDSVTALTAPYVDCKGLELSTREELNDKVIVDMKGYFNTNPSDIPSFQEPEELDVSETSDCYQGKDCSYACFSCYHRTAIVHDQMSDLAAYQEYVDDKPVFNPLSGTPNAGPIEPSDFAICHYRVFAYKLRAREWGMFHYLKEIILVLITNSAS